VLAARASGNLTSLVGALRETLASVDPGAVVAQSGTGPAVAGPSAVFLQVTAALTGFPGAFAMLLALTGLFGMLAHLVACRTREIGVRLALGASTEQIVWMIVGDGLRPVALGVVFGLLIGVLARLMLRPIFVRLLPGLDPLVLAVVPIVMLATGIVACYVPARRAAGVDPNVALRDL
jgi:putative ABC transport system permease protein